MEQTIHAAFEEGYVDILGGKALRDRRLYLSDELTKYLKEYDAKIRKVFTDREYFFPGGYGGMYSSSAISSNFRNIWISAGMKCDGKVKPRAYDFRHHFACANIMCWSKEALNGKTPYDVFSFFCREELLKKLHVEKKDKDAVTLMPYLLNLK